MLSRRFHTQAIALSLANDQPPTEFRLFKRGWNETEKGRFLFDDEAARSVMAEYEACGVDLAIDLEHQMLDEPTADPTARDARGWLKLELRNGELWAVDVRWTPDGAARLTEKRQRYVSPAFGLDPETKRVSKLLNVAITAMPATHKTPALVAASAGGSMDPKLVASALDAIEKGDAKAALDILKGLVASAAGGEPSEDGDDAGAADDGAEGASPPETDSAGPPAAADGADDAPPSSSDPKKKTEQKAMSALLLRQTGASTLTEALAIVDTYRVSHLTLESERAKLAKDRAVLEAADRRKLVTELVQLGAEFPATVWVDPLKKNGAIKPRWIKMPIEELRSHVADQRAARGKTRPAPTGAITPPAGTEPGTEFVALSAEQLAICAELKCDPKDFAKLQGFRDGKVS